VDAYQCFCQPKTGPRDNRKESHLTDYGEGRDNRKEGHRDNRKEGHLR
jgi:hypothetical protein